MPRPRSQFDIDHALLLIARGASTAQAGTELGLSGRTLEKRLLEVCPDAYRACIAARPHLADNHGTKSRYTAGCRCIECRAALAAVIRKVRSAKQPPEHGTVSGYQNHRCRCSACTAAHAAINGATRETATRQGMPWTSEELEVALRRDGDRWAEPAHVVATRIGRSMAAVRHARQTSRV